MLDRKTVAQLDSQQMLSSIEVLHEQCKEAWESTKQIAVDWKKESIDRVVFFGMGGSALGMHIVQTVFASQLRVPIQIVNDYSIPASVGKTTLAILASYSGSTEETLAVSQQILQKTPFVVVITTNGELRTFAQQHRLPAYLFTPQYNPSNQPRMALGYMVMGLLGICARTNLLATNDRDVEEIIAMLQKLQKQFGVDVPEEQNQAKQFASLCHENLPVLISAEFLDGSAHAFANQLNENSKQFSCRFLIPEMNHHLIEGLRSPAEGLKHLLFVFILSRFYHPRNQKRFQMTKSLIEQNGLHTTEFTCTAATPLSQVFELLAFGSYASFYLAIRNGIDPSPIPNIDQLKASLKKED